MSARASNLLTAAAAIAVTTAIAACGSNSPGSARAAGPGGRPARTQQDEVNFVGCMRSHGVQNWPDPESNGQFDKPTLEQLGVSRSRLQAASAGCQHPLPSGGQPAPNPAGGQAQIAALVAFARCLRSHGFSTFPDPTRSGELTHEMLANSGINLHQPAVRQAADACVGVTHGVVTRAVAARFVPENEPSYSVLLMP